MEALKKLQARVDALSLRERGILIGAIIVLTYFIFDIFVYQSIETQQKLTQTKIVQTNSMMAALASQLSTLSDSDVRQKQEQQKQEIRELRNDLVQLDQTLQQSTTNLVSPGQMVSLLQNVLGNTEGLDLRTVSSLGSKPLLITDSTEDEVGLEDSQLNDSSVVSNAYRHGLKIEFEGDYFSTLEYLKKLESLESSFFWNEVKFEVSEYPQAICTLSIYTISLNENWIGA